MRALVPPTVVALVTMVGLVHAQPRVDARLVEAIGWIKAALKGDAVPQLRLGEAYEQGKGVPADLAEATRWYAASAARGNPAAARQRLGGRSVCGESQPK